MITGAMFDVNFPSHHSPIYLPPEGFALANLPLIPPRYHSCFNTAFLLEHLAGAQVEESRSQMS